MLNLEQVLKGIEYRETIHLPFYNEDVEIRPLSDSEFAEARRKSGIIKVANTIQKKNIPTDNLAEIDTAVSALHLALVEIGVTDPQIRDNANKLMGGSLQLIGEAIIKLTTASRNDILNFSTATKDST